MFKNTKDMYVDANVFLDFIYSRDAKRCDVIRQLFKDASNERVVLTVIPQVIVEIMYVMEKVYAETRIRVHEHMGTILNAKELVVRDKDNLNKMMEIYKDTTFDLVDIYLHVTAKNDGAEVFSFDKDLEKLKSRF